MTQIVDLDLNSFKKSSKGDLSFYLVSKMAAFIASSLLDLYFGL